MIDRGIGIAGIALSVIFGALQFFQPQIPPWISILGVGTGIFMLGISFGVTWSGQKGPKVAIPTNHAFLRLHMYPDHRAPERLDGTNIYRWYYLSHIFVGRTAEGKKEEIVLPTLFIAFASDIQIMSLKVRSPDMRLPRHEIKDLTPKFAIISFSEKLNEGTLEIVVEP